MTLFIFWAVACRSEQEQEQEQPIHNKVKGHCQSMNSAKVLDKTTRPLGGPRLHQALSARGGEEENAVNNSFCLPAKLMTNNRKESL